jgi:hypothetical protein
LWQSQPPLLLQASYQSQDSPGVFAPAAARISGLRLQQQHPRPLRHCCCCLLHRLHRLWALLLLLASHCLLDLLKMQDQRQHWQLLLVLLLPQPHHCETCAPGQSGVLQLKQ